VSASLARTQWQRADAAVNRIFNDARVDDLLNDLYGRSKAQEAQTSEYFRTRSNFEVAVKC
jgi:hypothetical protein